MKILVVKNDDKIIISKNGKKLIINKDNELFEELSSLSKNEIIEFYKRR